MYFVQTLLIHSMLIKKKKKSFPKSVQMFAALQSQAISTKPFGVRKKFVTIFIQ